jgi:hypothetical protein
MGTIAGPYRYGIALRGGPRSYKEFVGDNPIKSLDNADTDILPVSRYRETMKDEGTRFLSKMKDGNNNNL